MKYGILVDPECRLSLTMNGITPSRLSMLLAALVLASPVAHGQQQPVDGLQPVDQRVADRGALSTSLRWVQYGLNQPYDFKDLYQLPVGTESYVRRNSGLWAVFPDSMYVNTEQGIYSTVPAGTVFYIGGPRDVLPQIERNQNPYRSTDAIPVNRAIESRIEASLLNHRIPASSVLAEMSNGRGPVDVSMETTATTTKPAPPPPPARSEIRQAWITAMPAFTFLHDEAYRRQLVMKAMMEASGSVATLPEADRSEPDPAGEQSSVQMQHLMYIIDQQDAGRSDP